MTAFDAGALVSLVGLAWRHAVGGIAVLAFLLLLWWPFVVAPFLGTWLLVERAGRPGWTSLVPVYNWIVLLRISGHRGWWLLLLCIPGPNVVAWAICCADFARAFGKGRAFGHVAASGCPVR